MLLPPGWYRYSDDYTTAVSLPTLSSTASFFSSIPLSVSLFLRSILEYALTLSEPTSVRSGMIQQGRFERHQSNGERAWTYGALSMQVCRQILACCISLSIDLGSYPSYGITTFMLEHVFFVIICREDRPGDANAAEKDIPVLAKEFR
eukprot:COSAG06_NODE_164_length_21596_cov_37.740500_17_plen_148_part_00